MIFFFKRQKLRKPLNGDRISDAKSLDMVKLSDYGTSFENTLLRVVHKSDHYSVIPCVEKYTLIVDLVLEFYSFDG